MTESDIITLVIGIGTILLSIGTIINSYQNT